MPRIVEANRLPMIDAHLGHYAQAEIINGAPILLDVGVGLPQLQTQRNEFETLGDDVLVLRETTLPAVRSQRQGIWGISPKDVNGVWLRLTQYKQMVATRLGARHPLARTLPNIGDIAIERYLTIITRFRSHWALVNAALATPLVLGPFTIAMLQAAHASLDALFIDIEAKEKLAQLKNEQQEQLFGDEPDDERELTSIIARLLLYHSEIESRFPGQPIADSLPEIFPPGPDSLPTFSFNVIQQPGAVLKVFYHPPDPALVTATTVFLKEGEVEQTQPVTSTTVGSTPVHNFAGITLVGDLDRLELRNGDGVTIARGVRDPSLAEPVWP